MDYQHHTIDDYLQDEDFVQWVLAPDEVRHAYWQDVLDRYPEQRVTITQARQLILQLSKAEEKPVEQQTLNDLWQNIESRTRSPKPLYTHWWRIAASIAAIFILTLGSWYYLSDSDLFRDRTGATRFVNTTGEPLWLALPDSSMVSLQPGSSLQYTFNEQSQQREARLKGRAFFRITRNPAQPFLVYTDRTITQVLGTSFWVKARDQGNKVEVDVVSGKVSVQKNTTPKSFKVQGTQGSPAGEAVVLLPNQRATYSAETDGFMVGLVEHPIALDQTIAARDLVFDDTTIGEITSRLSQLYGIPIQLMNKDLASCTFTGDVNAMPLHDILLLICRSIKARYQIDGTHINITGQGCG